MNWRVVLALLVAVLCVCIAGEALLALRAAPVPADAAGDAYWVRQRLSGHVLRALVSAGLMMLLAVPLALLAMAPWRALRWHRPLGDVLVGATVAVAAQIIAFVASTALQSTQALLRYDVLAETAMWGGAAGLLYWLVAGLPRAARR